MLEIFLRTVPFFLIIGLGYGAAATRLFHGEAVAALTRFVFYFALSAMIFGFVSDLPFSSIFDPTLATAYLLATAVVYAFALAVALWRRQSLAVAAVEAQCGVIGNIGFLGLPMLVVLIGPQAAGPIILMLTIDLTIFGSLIVAVIVASRGTPGLRLILSVGSGLVRNPMIMSIVAGLIWSGFALPVPRPAREFLDLLGGTATPCALFAIGASLAAKSAERLSVAAWLSFVKLFLHPAAVLAATWWFRADPAASAVVIASAAMPVAGNIYIIAQHYGVAPQRVSSAILISTAVSIVTLSATLAWLYP